MKANSEELKNVLSQIEQEWSQVGSDVCTMELQ